MSTEKNTKRRGPIAALAARLDLYVAELRSGVSIVEAVSADAFEQELLHAVPEAEARDAIRMMALELYKYGVDLDTLPEMLRHYQLSLQTWMDGRMHMVEGACPACGLHYLRFNVFSGMISCASPGCSNRFAATFILADEETEHILEVEEGRVHVQHPLRERIGNALLTCTVHQAVSEYHQLEPGRYRVSRASTTAQLSFEVLS